MTHLSRSALLAASALLAFAPGATAFSTETVAPGHLVDASSDGRYVLLERPGDVLVIVDRTAKTEVQIPGGGAPIDLAASSPRALIERGGELLVFDVATNASTTVNLDEDNARVPFKPRAKLAQDGRVVMFSTDDGTTRILQRDLTTGRTTQRVANGGVLFDASEDGRVVTYGRVLPTERRPSALAAHVNDPTSPVQGTMAGVQVIGDVPRLYEVTRFLQSQPQTDDPAACRTTPITTSYGVISDLQIQQDGQSPRYRFTLGGSPRDVNDTSPVDVWPRVSRPERVDPVSSAFAERNGNLPDDPLAKVIYDDRNAYWGVMGIDSASSAVDAVIPVRRGAAALYSSRAADGSWTTFAETRSAAPLPAGSLSADFRTIGSNFPTDTPAVRMTTNWAFCGYPKPIGTAADYAQVTTRSSGNSAGSVVVNLTPDGKVPATSVELTVRLGGFAVWTRRQTTSATVTLPQILPWTQGYKLYTLTRTNLGPRGSITPLYRRAW